MTTNPMVRAAALFFFIFVAYQVYTYLQPENPYDFKPIIIPNISDKISGGGGGGGLKENIMNVKLCSMMDKDDSCDVRTSSNNTVVVYWQVPGGVGCCHGYGCNYDAFYNACISPEFRLYEVIVDGRPLTIDLNDYEYECTVETPYNHVRIYDVDEGNHTIVIYQKDCEKVVDTETITFTLHMAENGSYSII